MLTGAAATASSPPDLQGSGQIGRRRPWLGREIQGLGGWGGWKVWGGTGRYWEEEKGGKLGFYFKK